jgi:hypothetical protein
MVSYGRRQKLKAEMGRRGPAQKAGFSRHRGLRICRLNAKAQREKQKSFAVQFLRIAHFGQNFPIRLSE